MLYPKGKSWDKVIHKQRLNRFQFSQTPSSRRMPVFYCLSDITDAPWHRLNARQSLRSSDKDTTNNWSTGIFDNPNPPTDPEVGAVINTRHVGHSNQQLF